MEALKKLNYFFYFISKKIGAAMLLALILTITAGVTARYVFGSPFTWTEELATFIFIWISFMGAVTASYDKRHVAVDFLVTKLPQRVQDVIKLFTYVAILVFVVLLVYGSFVLFPTMKHVSVALRLPKWLYYIPVCTASVEMFFIYLAEMLEYITNMMHPENKEGTV